MSICDLFNQNLVDSQAFQRPYIIAEAGVNHEGDLDLAYRLIEEAKEGGADAIKFQTYKASSLASKFSPSYWDLTKEKTTSQYELFKKYDSFWKKEYYQLASYCQKVDIEFLSTPFDKESALFLNDIMAAYKISSSDLNNKPFIDYLCAFNKPIILSTGASYLWEVEQSVSWIAEHGNPISLLHCILNYPTSNENANLSMITTLRDKFPNLIVGYSDHTLPQSMEVLEIATLLGAKIIEKHFTHDKTLPGNDHYHAMDLNDLKLFNKKLDRLLMLLGSNFKKPLESEEVSRLQARRSLVANRDIPKNTIISSSDITFKRPGTGLDPRYFDFIVGMKSAQDISEDSLLELSMFE